MKSTINNNGNCILYACWQNTYNLPPTPFIMGNNWNKPALAATVQGDRIAFFECAFKGVQDTLWDQNGRHYFRNCYIQGGVDFIFGNGQSVYEVKN